MILGRHSNRRRGSSFERPAATEISRTVIVWSGTISIDPGAPAVAGDDGSTHGASAGLVVWNWVDQAVDHAVSDRLSSTFSAVSEGAALAPADGLAVPLGAAGAVPSCGA